MSEKLNVKVRNDLAARLKNYYDACTELDLVYKELLNECLIAHAKGEEIPGYTIVAPGLSTDKAKNLEYAQKARWEIPTKKVVDYKALTALFKKNKVPVLKSEHAGSIRDKKSKVPTEEDE